jgi:hypothetical protein
MMGFVYESERLPEGSVRAYGEGRSPVLANAIRTMKEATAGRKGGSRFAWCRDWRCPDGRLH